MNDRIKQIEDELAAELTQLDGSLREIDERRQQLIADRERIDAGLVALQAGNAKPKKKRGQARHPCATKAEVADILRSLIEQNGPCPEDDLVGLAEDRLRADGKSLSGFKLRYDAVRLEQLVEISDGRLGLKKMNP